MVLKGGNAYKARHFNSLFYLYELVMGYQTVAMHLPMVLKGGLPFVTGRCFPGDDRRELTSCRGEGVPPIYLCA